MISDVRYQTADVRVQNSIFIGSIFDIQKVLGV